MPERLEYRVTWKRKGRRQQRAIRQTEHGAKRKVKALLWSDIQADDGGGEGYMGYSPFANLPPIEEGPTVETRTVGEWEGIDLQEETK